MQLPANRPTRPATIPVNPPPNGLPGVARPTVRPTFPGTAVFGGWGPRIL